MENSNGTKRAEVATDVRGVFTFLVHGGLVECDVYTWGEELGAIPLKARAHAHARPAKPWRLP